MFTIKINKKDDTIITRINGTIKEIAENYFYDESVISIEFLDGEITENEEIKEIPLKIVRATPEAIERFDLVYNVRYEYLTIGQNGKFYRMSTGILTV